MPGNTHRRRRRALTQSSPLAAVFILHALFWGGPGTIIRTRSSSVDAFCPPGITGHSARRTAAARNRFHSNGVGLWRSGEGGVAGVLLPNFALSAESASRAAAVCYQHQLQLPRQGQTGNSFRWHPRRRRSRGAMALSGGLYSPMTPPTRPTGGFGVGFTAAFTASSSSCGCLELVSSFSWRGNNGYPQNADIFRYRSRKARTTTSLSMSSEVAQELSALGMDSLIFLAATCAVVPACIKMNISPVLGFLGTGALLGPAGFSVIKDLGELNTLGELGISFLLFEQGLELSLDRLKALSKYAFGLGTLQVLLCTLAFAAFPFLGGVDLLEVVFHSPAELVSIRRVDEAVVIGAALSLSSSAFVLKILQEKGEKAGRFGRAVLGVLLLQDIAVVPLLVLLPIIETQNGVNTSLLDQLGLVGETVAKGVGGLGAILVAGRFLLRPVFDLVAGSRNSETFVALCLLVALGVGQLTESIGLSSTLGAFVAGTLLAETNYRTQVEANIAPFRGLLLGLFFTTTGATVDPGLLYAQWPTVLGLLLGLVTFKSIIISTSSLGFGLKLSEAVRTGLILSGGGEFAFVVLSLSQRLGVLPEVLNRLLIGVVVLSMALTPALSSLGAVLSEKLTQWALSQGLDDLASLEPRPPQEGEGKGIGGSEMVVICGFGPVGQIVGSLLSAPVIRSKLEADYVAFDLNPARVRESRAQGFPVFYGDGTIPAVLHTAGIDDPKAVVVTYTNNDVSIQAVTRLRQAFPRAPIFARATDYEQYLALQEAGAEAVVSDLSEISIRLGSELLESFGVARSDDVQSAKINLRQTLEELARKGDVRGDFSARFTPVMLNVTRDRAAVDGPGPAESWPEDLPLKRQLGVDICLLPRSDSDQGWDDGPNDAMEWDDDDNVVESGEPVEQFEEPAEHFGTESALAEDVVLATAVVIAETVLRGGIVNRSPLLGGTEVGELAESSAETAVGAATPAASGDGAGKSSRP